MLSFLQGIEHFLSFTFKGGIKGDSISLAIGCGILAKDFLFLSLDNNLRGVKGFLFGTKNTRFMYLY